jgi:ATP-dependent Clp protease ATP-binding subunit ClpB
VDFKNTVIILTSNLGGDILAAQPEAEDTSVVREDVMDIVRAKFRPEFLNRLDEIILFHRLGRAQMDRIVDIQVARLAKLLVERKIGIELDQVAREWLADAGYDPAYGARPLKRTIQRNLQDPLAELILQGLVKEGDTVKVSSDGKVLLINEKRNAATLH